MRPLTKILSLGALAVWVTANAGNATRDQGGLQQNSLCAKTEHIIFSCLTKSAGKQAKSAARKIASLCASPDLSRERGYLQYRYGLPGKIELQFPGSTSETQKKFQYSHYLRYQVDLTEINFQIDGYEYQIFDTYNGEEKPAIAEQGLRVTVPAKSKEVNFTCVTKASADYSNLTEVLNLDSN
jgi:hypothetical protein